MANSSISAELRQAWDSTPAAADDETAANGKDKTKGKTTHRRTGDRFATLNAFIDVTARELTPTEAVVWLTLYRDTKPDGTARTSQVDIGRRIGINARTAKRAVRRLCQLGLLTVVRRGGLRQGPSIYRVEPLIKPTR